MEYPDEIRFAAFEERGRYWGRGPCGPSLPIHNEGALGLASSCNRQGAGPFYELITKHVHRSGIFPCFDFGCGVGRLTFAWGKERNELPEGHFRSYAVANSNLAGRNISILSSTRVMTCGF
jgi:hypothetical protein